MTPIMLVRAKADASSGSGRHASRSEVDDRIRTTHEIVDERLVGDVAVDER